MTAAPFFLFMQQAGVPLETFAMLLIVPLVATVIVFARQIVGLKGFNIFTPLITALVFTDLGLEYGLAVFVLVVLISALTRLLLKKVRLQYLARMALVITAVTIALFLLFALALLFSGLNLTKVSILPLLVLIALTEQFVAVNIEHGPKVAFTLTAETLLTAVAGFGLMTWPWLRQVVLQWPEYFIAAVILINFLLGRWTGLRLLELWRFRALLKNKEL